MTKKLYSTPEIEVSWEPDLCIHSAKCVQGSFKVFNPRRRPWIELDHENAERILAIVATCPSGALKARRLGTGETGRNEEGDDPRVGGPLESGTGNSGTAAQELGPSKPVITASKNGPLLVSFSCVVKDADGNVIREVSKASLCRCGQSSNKPFCDGTHSTVNFQG
jgi:uncharacterized Fe-S cluster protein YjdI